MSGQEAVVRPDTITVPTPGRWARALAVAGQVWAILRTDIVLELRRRELLGTMGLFTLLVLVVLTFALDLTTEAAAAIAPGALWVAYLLAGMLGLGRAIALEREWGTLDGLRLAPLDGGTLYLTKVLGNLLFMLLVEAASLPIAAAVFGLPVLRLALLPVLLLGTLGFAAVGTLFATMAAHTRAREVLLPVLLLPVAVPVVIAGVQATSGVLDGRGVGPWLNVLVAFDAIVLVVAYLTFDAVLEE